MEVTIKVKGSENKKVFCGVDLIRDGGNYIHIHGFYQGVTFTGAWNKNDITFIDVLFFQ